jgi:hypothetical protein
MVVVELGYSHLGFREREMINGAVVEGEEG